MLNLKIPPPVVFIVVAMLMYCMARFSIDVSGYRLLFAGVFACLGVCIAIWALVCFSQHKTTINPHHPEKSKTLVASGIYAYTRNPMYLALAMLLISFSFVLQSLWSVWPIGFFILYITYFQIKPEEKILTETFGSAYVEYCKQVRRWL